MGIIIYRYAQMVIKTDPCSFTELRIYPGRGSKFAAKDGKTHMFVSSKARSLFHQKIKPVKLTWTQASRRYNKKIKVDEIKRKRAEDATTRDKALESTLKDLKERNTKKMQEKKQEKAKQNKVQAPKAPAVKTVKAGKIGKKGGKN